MSACDLFKGQAWTWFINVKMNVDSWDKLVDKLKEDFLPYFYDQDLKDEIRNRTMGQYERVTLFISSLEGRRKKIINFTTRKGMSRTNKKKSITLFHSTLSFGGS